MVSVTFLFVSFSLSPSMRARACVRVCNDVYICTEIIRVLHADENARLVLTVSQCVFMQPMATRITYVRESQELFGF